MIINTAGLRSLYTGFSTAFQKGKGMAASQWARVAMEIPSSTETEEYGWMGDVPGIREWLGDRVVNGIKAHGYSIRNKEWEQTIGVPRPKIEDDAYGVFNPLFEEMGRATSAHPDQLVFGLLKNGFAELCYDGQYFFDTDHPVLDANGVPQSVANTDGGSGAGWYLIDTSRAIKPIILQIRKRFQFVAKDRPEDDSVFYRNKFVYGVDGRSNVGFGLWQFAWGSKQTLDATHYSVAMTALQEMKGDYGRPLGLMPNLLVVSPSNRDKGLTLLNAERDAAGATNIYKGTAELLVVPWLA